MKRLKLKRCIAALSLMAVMGAMAGVQNTAWASPSETMPVWRVQVKLWTATVKDANTDDDIRVELNDSNRTWLDYGRNDFEKGDVFTYDLLQMNRFAPTGAPSIARLSDIQRLTIAKTGDNGWCLKRLQLLVNNKVIYNESLPLPGKWLDNDGTDHRTYTISGTKLRANIKWNMYVAPPLPFLIPQAESESRIESIVGSFIHGTPLYWDHLHGRAVEVSRVNDNTIHVDLDLAFELPWLPNPEVDVDFDLKITCVAGKITMTMKNVHVDVDSAWYSEVLSLGLADILDSKLSDGIKKGLQNFTYTLGKAPFCPRILVLANGNILFF